ncbi:flagellar motor stator protein MotA [Sulfurivermis fontis]|jgi:chemotaxis protein MotA|uniref:flagellar motor stator protein MotA n=1 Tax=Sulfurivermis fontis TaxID=1972068 RepID=UPI000FDBC114|nr:flagellar motor stator protein MotA [Sulfurivermis fontis]
MKLIVGILIVILCVFGGFLMSGGQLLALWHPSEIIIIAGGALGAFVVANPPHVIKGVLSGLPKLFGGAKYSKKSYMDLLALMYDLFAKARKEGLMALENDIEEPQQSEIFKKYPKILADHHALDFITDYMRLMVGGSMNPFELENLMDLELEIHHHEAMLPGESVTTVSDGLPGFGIVAAVMGVVITMASVGEPPEVLGAKIAAALVGTFLGILLAYGFVGPLATALKHRAEEEGKFLGCIKVCIMATLNGYTPQIAVEFGRKALPSTVRPGFAELEAHVKKK